MGIRVLERRPGRVVASMPVAGNLQPVGILHGGANAVLAETVASIAAWEYAGEGAAVGLDLSCTHHRWVATGTLTAVATPLHEGRSSATYEVVITDERGRRVCSARLTCALRTRTAGMSSRKRA